jgi:hypothetical protein|tara:strand:- start:307 stop:618 length:312 start_codon:yes stop_codon:yes gene_type:complete
MGLFELFQLIFWSQQLQRGKKNDERAEEENKQALAALQRPTILPWNFPNANGRRAMIVPGMWNEATGAYAPSETMWENQYTPQTSSSSDDDDDDALLDSYVRQ